MLRSRFKRFNSAKNKKNRNHRNLDNLHVIRTESVVGLKPAKPDLLLSAPPQEHLSTVQPVVQESQYDWYNPDCVNTNVCPSEEKNETTECTVETPVEESYFEEVEVASYEADGAHEIPVGFRKSKIYYLKYKRNCFFKPKIYNIGAQRTIVNCLNIQNSSTDIDVVSEAEYEIDCETDKSEKGESGEELHTFIEENEQCELEACEQIGDSLCTEEKNFTSKSGIRNYNSSIKNDEFDLYQGKSLHQSSLDSWKSHLIGLEYLLEIRNESKDSVMKYLCVLCNVELEVEGFPSVCVINHINGYKHMVKYLEKHFPACGYRFDENSNYDNNVILQKLCDVINRNLGYNFMCITSLAQYMNNKQKIVDIILNAHHFNGDSLQLENELLKTVDVILLDEVSDVLKDIIEQITPKDTVSSGIQLIQSIHEKLGKGSNSQLCLENADSQKVKSKCSELSEDTNSLNIPEPSSKGRRSKSLASYLKLTHARARLTKPKGHQVKETPSENSVSEQKGGSNKISDSKTVKVCKLDVFEHKGGSNNISESKTVKDCKLDAFEQKAGSNNISESKTVKECKLDVFEQKAASNNISESKTVKGCKLDIFEQKAGSSNISESKTVKECELISKQKARSDISESKTIKEYEVDGVTAEEDKFEITMTLRDDKARISKPIKIPKIIRPDARQKLLYKIKEKALQKQTMHSKHCRKRILGKENSRLRVTVKPREKSESVSDIISKTSTQYQSVGSRSTSERIVSEKKRENKMEELQHLSSKTTGSSSYKLKSPLRKVSAVPVHKTKIGSKSSVKGQPIATLSVRPKIFHKCPEKSKSPIDVQVRDFHSHKKITKVSRSKSPIKRIIRRHSKSPVRKIKSPLRLVRSPVRKSPVRKIKSPLRLVRSPVRKSPIRRHSRSPVRRRSRSPLRRLTRSPVRRRSRSPAKRHSRSPLRRHSRSPLRRRSKSPVRKQSRSPIRRYSRSPVRRFSRSPIRRYSRNSRSPIRRHSKSPSRRHSRSPGYRKSRSPHRRRSRTPLKRHSRSPLRRYSRSPVRKRSRSPLERHSRSPHHSPIKQYKSSYRGYSPVREHTRGIQGSINVHSRYSSPHYSMHDLSMNNKGNATSKNDKYHKLYPRVSGLNRDISDLDPVSDEDESVYFNTSDKRQHTEEPKMSQNSRLMLAQLLQKFSVTDANTNDPTLNKLMQFIDSHSDELQEVMGSQYSSDKRNPLKVDANIQDRNLILQQYLLSNLAGNTQESLTSTSSFSGTSNVPSDFPGPPFVQDRAHSPYGLAPRGTIQDPSQSTHNQSRYFPPNLNVPPPEHFHQFSHVPHGLSPKPKVPPENMFKDLKATVNKLFGANESVKQEKNKPNVPAYVTEPDPEKWDLNHPNAPKFSVPGGPKDIFHSQGKSLDFHSIPGGPGMRGSMPVSYKNNSGPTHFFNSRGIDRQQLPNVPIPPPDTKVAFCDVPSTSSKGNLFPVVNNMQGNPTANTPGNVSDVKVSLAQRLASVLVKVGMIDVPAPLLQEMLMKIGAFSSCPPQDIRETEIVSILKRLGYLT